MKRSIIYRAAVLAWIGVPAWVLLSTMADESVMTSSFALGFLVALAVNQLTCRNPMDDEKAFLLFWGATFIIPLWAVMPYREAMVMLVHYYIAVCVIAMIVCIVALAVNFLKKRKAA